MQLKIAGPGLTLALEPREAELLKLALRRATFEDTPPERQQEILGFATELLRALEAQD
jgi:hypothetical protein